MKTPQQIADELQYRRQPDLPAAATPVDPAVLKDIDEHNAYMSGKDAAYSRVLEKIAEMREERHVEYDVDGAHSVRTWHAGTVAELKRRIEALKEEKP